MRIAIGIVIGLVLGVAAGFLAPFLLFWKSNIGGSNPQLGLVSVFIGAPVGALLGAVIGAILGWWSRPKSESKP